MWVFNAKSCSYVNILKHVWLKNKDTFCLYNFIKILENSSRSTYKNKKKLESTELILKVATMFRNAFSLFYILFFYFFFFFLFLNSVDVISISILCNFAFT